MVLYLRMQAGVNTVYSPIFYTDCQISGGLIG